MKKRYILLVAFVIVVSIVTTIYNYSQFDLVGLPLFFSIRSDLYKIKKSRGVVFDEKKKETEAKRRNIIEFLKEIYNSKYIIV